MRLPEIQRLSLREVNIYLWACVHKLRQLYGKGEEEEPHDPEQRAAEAFVFNPALMMA
jgi:hypothetical protein